MHAALLLSLMACDLFKGCGEPDLPSPDDNDNDHQQDTSSQDDDTAIDTGPPPPCEFPEVEPNNSIDDAQPIEMEAWACGVLDQPADFDVFEFTNSEDGWIKVWVRGADIGSMSDLQLWLSDEDGDYAAKAEFQIDSTDPLLVAPVPANITWYLTISDQYYTYSDQHVWESIATMTKAPLDWTVTEVEDNDSPEEGQDIQSGDVIYGFINQNNDNDYYLIDIPEGGKSTITATTLAWNYGSPVNTTLKLRDPDGELITHARDGGLESDKDAAFETTVTDPGVWSIHVMSGDNVGGPLYWYILQVDVETEYDDTGAGD